MSQEQHTTAAVQEYLDALAGSDAVRGGMPAEPIVRALLARSVSRLEVLCATMLHRSYPRLVRPPLNLQTEEVLGGVVERLLKAMREVHPRNVRQFFALANRHMRWELNDLARRLDEGKVVRGAAGEMLDGVAAAPESTGSVLSGNARRMLEAIERLPEEEREVFDLVRIQGMAQTEAAGILGVAVKTVQRRLNRGLLLLSDELGDMKPVDASLGEGVAEGAPEGG